MILIVVGTGVGVTRDVGEVGERNMPLAMGWEGEARLRGGR
jgi:hypothetical protein